MVFPFDKMSAAPGYSYVRFLNAAKDTYKLKISVNGTEMHTAVNYKDFTKYDKAEKGTYTISIMEHGRECLRKDIEIDNEKIYTLAVTGTSRNMHLHSVCDVKRQDEAQNAYVRLCNLSQDMMRADIYINKIKVISSLNSAEASNYLTVLPKDYEISVNLFESEYEILTPQKASLESGEYYGAYLIGPIESPELLIQTEGAAFLTF